MRVICIDDSNRPEEVPLSSWIQKDKEYTVTNFFIGFGGTEIVQIAEIDIQKASGGIYKGFRANRFSTPKTNLVLEKKEKVIELA